MGRSCVNQIRRHFETNELGNGTESREKRKKERKKETEREKEREREKEVEKGDFSFCCTRRSSHPPRLLSPASLRLRSLSLPLKFPKHFCLISLYSFSLFSYPVSSIQSPLYPFIDCILDRPSVPFASFSVLANNNAFLCRG